MGKRISYSKVTLKTERHMPIRTEHHTWLGNDLLVEYSLGNRLIFSRIKPLNNYERLRLSLHLTNVVEAALLEWLCYEDDMRIELEKTSAYRSPDMPTVPLNYSEYLRDAKLIGKTSAHTRRKRKV